jgi:hypothetical protein
MPTVSVITAMGRERPELWAETAKSVERSSLHLPTGWDLQWCIHLDGIDPAALIACPWWPELSVGTAVSAGTRQGIALARNQALTNATGELVAAVDDDDCLGESWPEMVAVLAARPELGWVAGRTADIDICGDPIDRGVFPLPYGDVAAGDPARGLVGTGEWLWHCCAAMARTELVHAAGGWAALGWCEDISMWSAVTTAAPGHYLDAVVYQLRQHPTRSTHTSQRPETMPTGKRAATARAAASLRHAPAVTG